MCQFKEMNELEAETCRAISAESFNRGGELFPIKVGERQREKRCNQLITAVAIYLDSYVHLCLVKAIISRGDEKPV